MPSKDTFHEKNPDSNKWLRQAPIEQGAGAAVPKKRKGPATRKTPGILLRIFGDRADEIAEKLDDETKRRLMYPVKESVTPDGKREFEHDLGIEDRARSTRG